MDEMNIETLDMLAMLPPEDRPILVVPDIFVDDYRKAFEKAGVRVIPISETYLPSDGDHQP